MCKEQKLCKNCKNYKPNRNNRLLWVPIIGWFVWLLWNLCGSSREFALCKKPVRWSLRKDGYSYCTVHRKSSGDGVACGEEGEWFEEKD